MTKSGVFFLCTFRDLKRLCGHAGVSGYLLLPSLPLFPPVFLFSCFFFSFVLLNDCFIVHVFFALSHLLEDVRYTAACLFQVFTLLFICFHDAICI